MPQISSFYGITIWMYWNEGVHARPHFHARSAGQAASIDFAGELIAGSLPRRALALVAASRSTRKRGRSPGPAASTWHPSRSTRRPVDTSSTARERPAEQRRRPCGLWRWGEPSIADHVEEALAAVESLVAFDLPEVLRVFGASVAPSATVLSAVMTGDLRLISHRTKASFFQRPKP